MMQLVKAIAKWSQQRVDFFGAQNQFFGGYMIVNYILPYFLWYEPGINDDNALRLRFFGGILCGGIIARDYWIAKLKPFFPLYWHFSLMYCLLFNNFYMFMDSDGSPFWLSQIAIGLFILAVLVDSRTIAMLLPLGIIAGVGGYCLVFGLDAIHMDLQTMLLPMYMCFTVVIVNRFYRFVADEESREHNRRYLLVANQIASILRVAYSKAVPGLVSLKKQLPILSKAYKEALGAKLISDPILAHDMEMIKNLPDSFETQVNLAEKLVLLELGKFQQLPRVGQNFALGIFSITDCIEEVLDNYPFAVGQKMLIGWQGGDDFKIKANRELFAHMMFNLMLNSLDQIASNGRGRVSIWIEKKGSKNHLYFMDTAGGASARETPFLFDAFYTKTPGRVGLGLTFCKRVMSLFHGKVKCKAIAGKQK